MVLGLRTWKLFVDNDYQMYWGKFFAYTRGAEDRLSLAEE
jgi:hypothetical protein